MARGRIRWGTSSWAEKSWLGSFYPPGTPPGDFLTVYAEAFDTVEADVTYYRVPDERMVSGWRRKTPDGFTLSAKFPRSVVHAGDGARPDPDKLLVKQHVADDTHRFLERMAIPGERCGPLVLQFPYFNRRIFSSKEPFLERLADFLDGLARWAELLVSMRESVPESYVYANNHYAGHGPATIRDLAACCGESPSG